VQDAFLKGDKHIDSRIEKQKEVKAWFAFLKQEEAMKQDELARQAAQYSEKYCEESEHDFIVVKEKADSRGFARDSKSFNRIVEEGVYNITD